MDVNDEKKKSTLDFALDLTTSNGVDFANWQTRGLGLNLVMLSLAEVQAKRVKLLSDRVLELEKTVFSDQIVKNLSPTAMMSTYRAATESLAEATGFIKTVLHSTDWTKVEADLLLYQSQAKLSDSGLTKELADDLLKAMAKLKSGGSIELQEQDESSEDRNSDE